MTWLRDHVVQVLVGLAVLMAVGTVSGWVGRARWKGVADANAAEAERLQADVQAAAQRAAAAAARAHVAELRADSATEHADSIETATAGQRETDAAAIAELEARLKALDTDAIDRAAEAAAEAEANDGWVRYERYAADTDSLRRRAELADSARNVERRGRLQERDRADAQKARADALEVHVGKLQAQVGGLTEQLVAVTAQGAAKDREIEALRKAESAGGLLPDLGAFTDPILVVGGILVGYTIAEIR